MRSRVFDNALDGALRQKYMGSQYPLRDDEQRIRFALAPERVFYMNQRG